MRSRKEKTPGKKIHVRVSMKKKYNSAFKLFITGKHSYKDISETVKVSTPSLLKWVKSDGWDKAREDVRIEVLKELEKRATDSGVKYVLDICDLQGRLEAEIDGTDANSKEGLVREIRELEKLKLLKLGKPTEIVGLTADDFIKLDKEAELKNDRDSSTGKKSKT